MPNVTPEFDKRDSVTFDFEFSYFHPNSLLLLPEEKKSF